MYFLALFNDTHGTFYSYQMLRDVMEGLDTEQDFFALSAEVRDSMIEAVQSAPAYERLAKDRLEAYNVSVPVSRKDVYGEDNDGKHFISIDLVKANFQALKHYDLELVRGCGNYALWVRNFTDIPYFQNSKYLRQVMFGNCLPKKQQKIQKWMIAEIIEVLTKRIGYPMDWLCSASSDEVVIRLPDSIPLADVLGTVRRYIDYSNVDTHVEGFKLVRIGDKPYYVRELANGEVDFKGVPAYFLPQVYKKYFGKPLNDMDLSFFFEGQVAQFQNALYEDAERE
jgi:hypothetical protein